MKTKLKDLNINKEVIGNLIVQVVTICFVQALLFTGLVTAIFSPDQNDMNGRAPASLQIGKTDSLSPFSSFNLDTLESLTQVRSDQQSLTILAKDHSEE